MGIDVGEVSWENIIGGIWIKAYPIYPFTWNDNFIWNIKSTLKTLSVDVQRSKTEVNNRKDGSQISDVFYLLFDSITAYIKKNRLKLMIRKFVSA